jgi:hypothetical protein
VSSPLEIKIALHYWCSSEPYDGPEANSPAFSQITATMCSRGLLVMRNGGLDGVHDVLKVYVETLCAVPWPVQMWVIPKEDQ